MHISEIPRYKDFAIMPITNKDLGIIASPVVMACIAVLVADYSTGLN